jgi:hypothetical protein
MSLPFQGDHWLPGFNFNVEEWDPKGQNYETLAICRTAHHGPRRVRSRNKGGVHRPVPSGESQSQQFQRSLPLRGQNEPLAGPAVRLPAVRWQRDLKNPAAPAVWREAEKQWRSVATPSCS